MFRELELLETFGNELREPHSKSLGDGIYEIRAKVASDITREALIKSRLTTWHTSCLQIFRHLARKLLEIRKYSCVAFVQADKKSDGAICAPDLISTSLIPSVPFREQMELAVILFYVPHTQFFRCQPLWVR